jgi:hypothetical protein
MRQSPALNLKCCELDGLKGIDGLNCIRSEHRPCVGCHAAMGRAMVADRGSHWLGNPSEFRCSP